MNNPKDESTSGEQATLGSYRHDPFVTMKQCNGCKMIFGTFSELWVHKKQFCKNILNDVHTQTGSSGT